MTSSLANACAQDAANKPMRTIRLDVVLTYNPDEMHGEDPEDLEWFVGHILTGTEGELVLHSNYIGDSVGMITVLRAYQ